MAVAYHARQKGIKMLGLQPTPSLAASEAKGKQAIEMTMLLKELQQSPFANESWTLQDTSVELVLSTPPQRTFKKLPYTVNVWFDNDPENAFPYINYKLIYTRDESDNIYKAEGQVDYNGLFYVDVSGVKSYYKLFADDARVYSTTGTWTVRYNHHVLSPPTTSTRPPPGSSNVIVLDSSSDDEAAGPSGISEHPYSSTDKEVRFPGSTEPEEEAPRTGRESPAGSEAIGVQQRKPRSPKVQRAKADSSGGRGRGARGGRGTGGGGGGRRSGGGSAPSAGEVGSRHFSVAKTGLTNLERLQEEARDPLIISVQGPPNCLKCWRHRLKKNRNLYDNYTTVYKWIHSLYGAPNSRILISFKSATQRQKFLTYVTIPKHCKFSLGQLDAL